MLYPLSYEGSGWILHEHVVSGRDACRALHGV